MGRQRVRYGNQNPTRFVFLDKRRSLTHGPDAAEIYEKTGRKIQPWQLNLVKHILSYDKNGIWIHSKFGYSVPRRNGKNEIVAIIELYGLMNGMRIMHTAHRTTTSTTAFERLYDMLCAAGYVEGGRGKVKKADEDTVKPDFKATRQKGLERITMDKRHGGGFINFRTRSSKGGLGEGYDLLIIDEAQEYTDDQDTALKYVVSDSPNPLTLYTGTPPTTVSAGTVFVNLRNAVLDGGRNNTGWAEWSVPSMTDVADRDAWYSSNPAMSYQLNERKIEDEAVTDPIDFNIQRLGLWIQYNQKSAISETEWDEIKLSCTPKLKGKIFVGIKYGKDGANVALSIASRTVDGRIFVESVDCRTVRAGNGWILDFLKEADVKRTAIDGANGQAILEEEMKREHIVPKAILPTVKEIIKANALFESNLQAKVLCHMGQHSLRQSATNCDKRNIGTNGGFGYKSLRDDIDVSILDSVILAQWLCSEDSHRQAAKIQN